jgi:hypothetical protein
MSRHVKFDQIVSALCNIPQGAEPLVFVHAPACDIAIYENGRTVAVNLGEGPTILYDENYPHLHMCYARLYNFLCEGK